MKMRYMDRSVSDWKCIRGRHVIKIKDPKASKEDMVQEILLHFESVHGFPKRKSRKILANVVADLKKRSEAKTQKKRKG